VPSKDMHEYDAGRPALAVEMGQESVECPLTSVAEPQSSTCPADQVLRSDTADENK